MRQQGDLTPPRELLTYTIPCACGHVLTGERRQEFQRLPCPVCQAEIFVLPRSPLPPVPSLRPDSAPPPRPTSGPGNILLYLFLGLVALTLVIVVVVAARRLIFTPDLSENHKTATSGDEARSKLVYERIVEQARNSWRAGEFALAQELVQTALSLEGKLPTPDLRRRQNLEQLAREIRLYADQSHETLEEILHQASGMKDTAWQATFRQRYLGKTFLLDVEMTRAQGVVTLRYHLDLPDEKVVLDAGNLEVLTLIPGEGPQRVLLGAALADIRRRRAGLWQVTFNPASAVLLTEPEPAAACCPALADPLTRMLLQRQQILTNSGHKIGKN